MAGIKKQKAHIAFQLFNHILLSVFGFIMLVPFLSVLSTSLSSRYAVGAQKVFIFPVEFTLDSWRYIFSLGTIWRSLVLTIFITVVGTFLALCVNGLTAYPLSKKEFAPARFILMGIVISMIFKSPVIPYFLTLNSLGFYDNILVLVIPHLIMSYNLIILITFLRQVPKELEESAMIEGCGYMRTLFMIILPSSKAAFATVGLFYAVMLWNQFTTPLLFIQKQELYPLQLLVRTYISEAELPTASPLKDILYDDKTIKAVVIMFTILPIVLVYPYLQKYFIKGAMIGSVKG